MGFFSWKTNDTGKSIPNKFQNNRPTFRVYMKDNKGNVWIENDYEGYGEFGGKDYYELLAEMNGLPSDRIAGINLAFKDSPNGDNPNCLHPNLFEKEYSRWIDEAPEGCKDQGFFYDGYSHDDEDNW